ncbi:MAG: LytTR family DNA-binding domain-containing protein [Bacteroidota bacterium]
MDKQLSCLIIEDEPIAAEVLQDYVQQVGFLVLKGICTDAIFALERLRQETIDVIFLDIHLPKLKGLDLLKTLAQPPQTILTTAYHEYALDAFELSVVDYLMKPIDFPRFLKAVNKLQRQDQTLLSPNNTFTNQSSSANRPFRFFNVNKKMVKVFFDEVLYVESLKDYARIVTPTIQVVTRGQIGEMEQLFAPHGFLRIHRSYLVALRHISAYTPAQIEIGQQKLVIGRSYKAHVARVLDLNL